MDNSSAIQIDSVYPIIDNFSQQYADQMQAELEADYAYPSTLTQEQLDAEYAEQLIMEDHWATWEKFVSFACDHIINISQENFDRFQAGMLDFMRVDSRVIFEDSDDLPF